MKIKLILFTAFFGLMMSSCYDLNLKPKGILGEPELFGNEFGVKKYFTGIYNSLPIEDFTYYPNSGYHINNWDAGKVSQGNMSGEFVNTWVRVNSNGFGYWPYDRIRDVNVFIQNFPHYKAQWGDVPTYNSLLGEAHFLRAFYYFGLAKRYGGVPIITIAQDPTGNLDSLKVSRAKEYDTWKFIHDDLQFAIDNMKVSTEPGRANKYVAAALMSRAMLYAGSVAKYTDYLGFKIDQLAAQQGYAGIDPSKANEFFQYSYDAGKLIEQGPYSLYTKNYPDKALNFANLFLDDSSPENIFVKYMNINAPGNTVLRSSYDALMCPYPDMTSNVGAESYPSLDMMRLYEFPAITDAAGKPIRFNNRQDIKTNMEPRLKGTMYFDGDILRGKAYSIQRGLYLTFPGPASDAQNGNNTAPINVNTNRIFSYGGKSATYSYNGSNVLITGAHGCAENEGGESNSITGAYIRKYVNPSTPTSLVNLYTCGTSWVVFRLGEIYLNTAEAAYELGKKDEALGYIQKLRVRAGCLVTLPALDVTDVGSALYGYPVEASMQFIRDERYRELFGENHRWWDLLRWRIVDRVLNNYIPRVLSCYHVLSEDKYIYLDEHERWNMSWTASKSAMYEGIPQGEINKNSHLLPQNPLR